MAGYYPKSRNHIPYRRRVVVAAACIGTAAAAASIAGLAGVVLRDAHSAFDTSCFSLQQALLYLVHLFPFLLSLFLHYI